MRRLILLVAVAAALVACAKARPGPCTVTACGHVCCPNDGKVCPPCWTAEDLRRIEERSAR